MPRSSALQLWELEGLGFEAAESVYRVSPRTRPNEEAKPGRKASPRVRTIETQPCERSSSLRNKLRYLDGAQNTSGWHVWRVSCLRRLRERPSAQCRSPRSPRRM